MVVNATYKFLFKDTSDKTNKRAFILTSLVKLEVLLVPPPPVTDNGFPPTKIPPPIGRIMLAARIFPKVFIAPFTVIA